MINITYNNSIYSEDITELEHITVPQKVHQVTDGGMLVRKGITPMHSTLVDTLLQDKEDTMTFINDTFSSSGRNGLILASGNSKMLGYGSTLNKSEQYPTVKLLPLSITQIYAGKLANSLGEFEYISTDATSCVSGHAALYQANLLVKSGELDRVIVISADNGIAEESLKFFREQTLTLSLAEETKQINKFRLGQAANVIVLENDIAMKSSGNTAVGLLHGISLTAEINSNPLGIRKDGAGYKLAIDKVLKQANMVPKDINVVKKHNTLSTDNEIENKLVSLYFKGAKEVSYKTRIGHTMGSSTAVEMDIAMKEESGVLISLGAGMGNVFTAAIVEIISGN